MLKIFITTALFLVGFGVSVSVNAHELEGNYNPEELVEIFRVIGKAELEVDESGTGPIISGSIMAADGTLLSYRVVFFLCDVNGMHCGNVLAKYSWPADKKMIWCVIKQWEAVPSYSDRAWAGFAFDKITLIRDRVGYNGYNSSPLWLWVQLWKKELLEFHSITRLAAKTCT